MPPPIVPIVWMRAVFCSGVLGFTNHHKKKATSKKATAPITTCRSPLCARRSALNAWCELSSPSQQVGEGQARTAELIVEPHAEDSPMIVKAWKWTVAETMAVRGFGRVRELCIASNIG